MGYRNSETYTYLPMRGIGLCLPPLKGHYKLFGAPVWSVWLVWSVCRAKFTPLNKFHSGNLTGQAAHASV